MKEASVSQNHEWEQMINSLSLKDLCMFFLQHGSICERSKKVLQTVEGAPAGDMADISQEVMMDGGDKKKQPCSKCIIQSQ